MSPLTLLCLFGLIYSQVSAELGTEAIIGGEYAKPGDFKYMIALYYANDRCGGAIIDDNYVLTAAHCVTDGFGHIHIQKYTVVAGTHNLKELHHAIIVPVETVYIPKKYIRQNLHDIAVLKLKHGLGLHHHHQKIGKIRLPRSNSLFENVCAVVSGYGFQEIKVRQTHDGRWEEYDGKTDDKLKFANTRVISNHKCMETNNRQVFPTELCAKVEQRHKHHYEGVCNGDSGSPLVYGDEIIGVQYLSPFACNETVLSAIYTRVSSYANMINHIITHGNPGDDFTSANVPH